MNADRAAGAWLVYAAALLAVLIWAATPPITKIAVQESGSEFAAMIRSLGAALLVLPLAWRLRDMRPRGRGQWTDCALAALGGPIGFVFLFSYGLGLTSAAHAAAISASGPLFTGLFAFLVARRWPGHGWWIGAGLGVVGGAIFAWQRHGLAGGDSLGDALILVAFMASSAGYIAGTRLASAIGSLPATVWSQMLGGLLLLPLAPWLMPWQAGLEISARGWAANAYMAVCATLLAYFFWNFALARGGAARIGAVQFAQPVLALGLAWALLGEAIPPGIWLSVLVIVAGVALAQKR